MTLPPLPSPNMVHQSRGTTLLGYKEEKLLRWGEQCREAALEEAATVCEGHYGDGFRIAKEVRNLK